MKKREEEARKGQNKQVHTLEVNRVAKKGAMDFGLQRGITSMLSKVIPDKTKKLEEIHYRQEANKEVMQGSSLFRGGTMRSNSGELEPNEGKIADQHMKRMWRAETQ